MATITINKIDSAPASAGGGLFINDDIYVDPKYDIKIVWAENTLTITPSKPSRDIYVGSISSVWVNGKRNPDAVTDLINWLKVGTIDVGGDGGFTVSIKFNPQYFTGDGSDDNPVSLKVEEIPVDVSNVMLCMDPNVFEICTDTESSAFGLITLKRNVSIDGDEIQANRFTLKSQENN